MKLSQRSATLALVLAIAATCVPATAQGPKRIQLELLEAMFVSLRASTPLNVDGPLLWGYFFFDPSRAKLEQAANELQSAGYRVVGIEQFQNEPRLRLHVERVEAHTPATLNARNQELYALAERLALASYDGMDVGPVPPARTK
jgi:hypothetical protein